MDIKRRILKKMVASKRKNKKFTHILMGRKETTELENVERPFSEEEQAAIRNKVLRGNYDIDILKVDKPEYLALCYLVEPDELKYGKIRPKR